MTRVLLLKKDVISYSTAVDYLSDEMSNFLEEHSIYQFRVELAIECRSYRLGTRSHHFILNFSWEWEYGYFHIYPPGTHDQVARSAR